MTCSEALNQLSLLLWKSWLTLLRSPGWAAVQIVFTLLTWGSTIGFMNLLATSDERTSQLGIQPDQYYIADELREPVYRCLTEAGGHAATDLNFCSSNASNSEYLTIRALNETTIDVDYYASFGCESSSVKKPASDQFNNEFRNFTSCEAPAIFRRIAQQAGKLTKLAIRFIDPFELKSSFSPSSTDFIIGAYSYPIMFFCLHAAIGISQEATSQIKDYLLSMGMSRSLYFFHHFVFNYLKTLIVVIGSSAIIGVMYKSATLAFSLLSLFSLSLSSWIALSLLVGAAFKKPVGAVIVMVVLWSSMQLFAGLLAAKLVDVDRTSWLSLVFSLCPHVAIGYAIDARREADLRGMNIWFAELSEAVPQGYFMLMLLFDTILFFSLTLLVDWVRCSFENPLARLRSRKTIDALASSDNNQFMKINHEQSDSRRAINAELVLQNVHKVYSTGEHAVKDVYMSMYKGQVTALLGHNGAGKSTIFSMIAGMTVPTEGTIEIHDAETRADRQKLIGYCPQYNAIFPKLTVDEHLEFFACLKGAEGCEIGERVLTALGMQFSGDAKACQLSGGMKRKLCIAIAMAGDSPIVLLDEPTAGLDPGARRDFERLLLDWKKDHTILLTTHYTDEAELLADKIFIMARGKVFCSGTPHFLRKRFDSGFVLSFAVENESDTERACDEMMKIAKEFAFEDVTLKKRRGRQFEFKLATDDTSRFVEMFRKMEAFGPYLGVQSYGLSLNKLEHVFLKVGQLTGTVDRSEDVEIALNQLIQENDKRVTGAGKEMKQFGIGLFKRLHYDIAHLASLLFMLLIIFFLTYNQIRPSAKDDSNSTDFLSLSGRYRIGLDNSLHDKFDEFQRVARMFGEGLIIDKTSSIADWFLETGRARPPVLGGVEMGSQGDWTIHIPSREQLKLPTLEAIVAMVNNPELSKVKFDVRESKGLMNVKRKDDFPSRLLWVLVLVSPFMVVRPISFYITERVSCFGHQERLTGVSRFILLFSSILYDFLIYLVHFFAFLGACLTVTPEETRQSIGDVILLPLLAFLSAELFLLTLYRFFSTRARGFMIMLCFVFFSSLIEAFGPHEKNLLILSPMATASFIQMGDKDWKMLIYITAHFLVLVVSFVIVEARPWETCKIRKNRRASRSKEVSMTQTDSLVLRVTELWKYYGPKKLRVPVVKGITFGVRSHECFGVLGINGAGKTSTFEMLTGNVLPDGGTASVGGVDCSAPAIIGYCPQSDALMGDLTGRQSLVVLAALHGYSDPWKVAGIVLTCVGMTEQADKRTKRYSGGQRRKISVAASLLAQNSLIILDEPTAGIDPIARRDIWSVLCALRESTNTAVVLTSHSMDEVEALVSNLIIMREGSIVVEGSPQEIKTQFGGHYNLCITIEKIVNVDSITQHIRSFFPGAALHDSSSMRNVKYRIPRRASDVFSDLFEKAEDVAEELKATEFSFTQSHATLEDAFMLAASGKSDVTTAVAAVTSSLMTKVKSESGKEETEGTTGGISGTEGNGGSGSDFTGIEGDGSGKTTGEA